MAAYRRVCDSHHLQADCLDQSGARISSGTLHSVIEYGYLFNRLLTLPNSNLKVSKSNSGLHDTTIQNIIKILF